MDSSASDNSISLDAIRKTAISRRGGVRVRGGRLPPIRIRDVIPASNKKVIAPKIPQRRVKIEQENPEPSARTPAFSKDERKDSRKPFGRGRGQRVYIQTEGSFLEQGPALRLKKVEPRYERMPRSSSRTKSGIENKVNSRQINLLLEGYDDTDAYSDEENYLQPVRLPYIKMDCRPKIKEEILDNADVKLKIKEEILDNTDVKLQIKEEILDNEDVKLQIKEEILDNEEVKLQIKEEILDNEDVKLQIKKEPEDDAGEMKGNCVLPEVKTTKQEIPETKICSLMEAVKLSQEEDVFVLFQLPSCLPFKRYNESSDKKIKKEGSSTEKDENTENSQDDEQASSFKDMPEGSVGKLQVMKSGQVRLALGSVDIAMESAVNEGGTAEVVSIPLTNEDGGDFTVLGEIYQKMIMYPILMDSKKEIKFEKTSE